MTRQVIGKLVKKKLEGLGYEEDKKGKRKHIDDCLMNVGRTYHQISREQYSRSLEVLR